VLGLVISVALHGLLAASAWVAAWMGFGGLSLPRREYAVEIVGVNAEDKPPEAAPAEPAEEPKKPEPTPEKKPEKKKPAKTAGADKAAKPPAEKKPDAPALDAPKPPAKDDAPAVAEKKEPEPEPAPVEDPAVPWPLDAREQAAQRALDLPGSAPGDAALLIAFRLDRLRGSPWTASVEKILAPLPDYQTIIAGQSASVADLFDLVFIATPDVTDVTATFLAAHHHRDQAELQATLAGPGTPPRVIWSTASGGTLGKRTPGGGVLAEDPRVYLLPEPGWIVLARPEHLPGMLDAPAVPTGDAGVPADAGTTPARPRWMERMVKLVGDPKAALPDGTPEPGPVAIGALANLGKRRLNIPGIGILPAPAATMISVFVDADGFRVVAVLDFASPQLANDFSVGAIKARDAVLGSLITRHFLGKYGAERAVGAMKVVARAKQVALSTHIGADDARVMIDAAAEATAEWMAHQRGEP
jgi:hypothetical protein